MGWGDADVGKGWSGSSTSDFKTDWQAPDYVTPSGQPLHRVHHESRCRGEFCVIHRPMPGPWESWPTYWRDDRAIMERICPCGIGHPVAEDYGFVDWWGLVHGCCGCPCQPHMIKERE